MSDAIKYGVGFALIAFGLFVPVSIMIRATFVACGIGLVWHAGTF